MSSYSILTGCHVVFTIAALAFGLVSIVVNPKGGELHKKSGRFYVLAYAGVVLSAFLMLLIKFKLFFFALTLFGTFLLVAGYYYSKKEEKVVARNWWILSILLFTVFIYLVDAVFVLSNIKHIGFGWTTVRLTFALIALATLIFELSSKRNRIVLHATMMLLSFIPLINGLLARVAPSEFIWVSWIVGYVICIPLILVWFKKTKKMQLLFN